MRGGPSLKGKGGLVGFRKNKYKNVSSLFRAVLRTLIKIYTFAPNLKFGTK